tara:strand:- start:208 stop:729 length:522 start_codon:yes stop_codon:yes gene_type:complete
MHFLLRFCKKHFKSNNKLQNFKLKKMKILKIMSAIALSMLLFTGCEKDTTSPISSTGIENQKQTVSNNKSSVNYTYYQSIADFTSEVNDSISSSEALASSTGNPHGFSIVNNNNGYGISEISNLSGSGVTQGDVNLCGECGPVYEGELHSLFDSDPCWWMVAFTNHVWGWDGC